MGRPLLAASGLVGTLRQLTRPRPCQLRAGTRRSSVTGIVILGSLPTRRNGLRRRPRPQQTLLRPVQGEFGGDHQRLWKLRARSIERPPAQPIHAAEIVHAELRINVAARTSPDYAKRRRVSKAVRDLDWRAEARVDDWHPRQDPLTVDLLFQSGRSTLIAIANVDGGSCAICVCKGDLYLDTLRGVSQRIPVLASSEFNRTRLRKRRWVADRFDREPGEWVLVTTSGGTAAGGKEHENRSDQLRFRGGGIHVWLPGRDHSIASRAATRSLGDNVSETRTVELCRGAASQVRVSAGAYRRSRARGEWFRDPPPLRQAPARRLPSEPRGAEPDATAPLSAALAPAPERAAVVWAGARCRMEKAPRARAGM